MPGIITYYILYYIFWNAEKAYSKYAKQDYSNFRVEIIFFFEKYWISIHFYEKFLSVLSLPARLTATKSVI